MNKQLYALLVGINDYQLPIPVLHGCLNDITSFRDWIEGQAEKNAFQPHLSLLTDNQATRKAVIEGFRQHLCKAGKDDVALFYYSGHGSQEVAPQEFWPFEPDHRNETLVLYDSREPGSWDLADKELAILISEVANSGAHIVVILDSCHSGSGTRNYQIIEGRFISADIRPRPADSYLFSISDLQKKASKNTREAFASGWDVLPEGRHILLAACRSNQTAKEYYTDGKHWGVFSYFLQDALKRSSILTYRDVYKLSHTGVRANTIDQNPQLEANVAVDIEQAFLGGAVQNNFNSYTVRMVDGVWQMDAGLIHGIPQPNNDQNFTVSLFPIETSHQMIGQTPNFIAEGNIVRVLPNYSHVELVSGEVEENLTYRATITNFPMSPIGIQLEGDDDGLFFIRQVLNQAGPQNEPSLFIKEGNSNLQFRLLAHNDLYIITRPNENSPLVAHIDGYSFQSALKVVQELEHIARWLKTVELYNPIGSLNSASVSIRVIQNNQELNINNIELSYLRNNNEWKKPNYTFKIKNLSGKGLFCALIGLWESFGIDTLFSPSAVIYLEPNEEYNQQLWGIVPDELWQQGISTRQDILKLIVSTEEFDAYLLTQEGLNSPRRTRHSRKIPFMNSLNRLMSRIQTRESSNQPEPLSDDWQTYDLIMSITRPPESQQIPVLGKPVSLREGIIVEPHANLKGKIRIGTVPNSFRDIGLPPLPEILRIYSEETQLYSLNTTREGTVENLLELIDVQNSNVVAYDSPLRIRVSSPLNPDEKILAFGFDGQFFLPLGIGYAAGKETVIDIYRLPEPISISRNIQSSIRILFQKMAYKPLGLPYTYPILSMVTLGEGGELTYESDIEKVKNCISQAQRINLYIHGFTGDSSSMVKSFERTHGADVILAFDYESIKTPVEATARDLMRRLLEVDLGPKHNKELNIIAHSLGGIVARWLIEREGGDKVVQNLIMLGSPNLGTPWPKIHQWATLCLGMAINSLTVVSWPVKILIWLLNLTESVDETLDQIVPGSDFLETLNASKDPHVPYILIAGNTSIITEANGLNDSSQIKLLITHLGYKVADFAFLKYPNDVAVGVHSVHGVPSSRDPEPYKVTIPCDHMSFFNSEAGVSTLNKVLNGI